MALTLADVAWDPDARPPVSDPGRELVSVSRLVEPRQTPAVVVALRGVTSLKHTHHYTHGRTRSSIAQNDLQRRKRHDICQGVSNECFIQKEKINFVAGSLNCPATV